MKINSKGLTLIIVCYCIAAFAVPLLAQDGEVLFKTWCSSCHEAGGETRAPRREVLRQMTPEQILAALEKGAMLTQGLERSRAERRVLAEYLSGKKFGAESGSLIPKSAYCSTPSALRAAPGDPAWNGWGATTANTRFEPAAAAGISADDLPRLKLKWAFGFPGAASSSAQPVVWGGRVFNGGWEGDVYSLDAKTGCIYWSFEADSSVRAAITIGKSSSGFAAYFGDLASNVYAVDAATGKLLWKTKVEDFPLSRITGGPTLYEGRLFVPVASREEAQGSDSKYECCKFRGSVVALDAATGKRIWKTYVIPEEPRPGKKNRAGTQLWGPSGGGVWNAPTVDAKRNLIYFGTGNSYSFPASPTTDAIIALDIKTGKIRWVRQFTGNDVWVTGGCQGNDPAVCAEDAPDFDFGASPILVERKGAGRLLLAPQKSGVIYALDPDHDGKLVWQQRVGKGSGYGGIVWGSAVDGENIYAAIDDPERVNGKIVPNSGGGLAAVSLSDGKIVWHVPAPPCGDKDPCGQLQAAAVTAIPGVVFSGSVDGHLRGYSTRDGKIIWDYDTAHEYTAVDGVKTKGGSISQGGAAIVGGTLFTNSGYSRSPGVMTGNALLVFSLE